MAKMYLKPPSHSRVPDVIRQDIPVWRLRENCYFDDTFFEAGTVLETAEEFTPNLGMFPLNKLAYDKYREFLTDYDVKGKDFEAKMNRAYVSKLPAFDREWASINGIAKQKRLHLVHAAATTPPILGAPKGEAKVAKVDMSSMPVIPFEDNTAIGKGNTMDKDMSSAAAVRASTAA